MFKIYDDLVPNQLDFHVSNSIPLSAYPEYNLPPLEVPNLSDPTTTSEVFVNEIFDLFNAQRLSGFENDIVDSIRSNIMASSPFADAVSKLSDEEIMESIKPRNLQSPSQLMAWSKYIQSIIEDRLTLQTEEVTSVQGDGKASDATTSGTE